MNNLVHGGDIYSKKHIENLVDFSANINPFGMPESVKQAIIENVDLYTNYPDPLCRELREAIAINEGCRMDNVICGNGAADIIFKIAIAIKPKKALLLAPTFAEYEEAIKLVNGEIDYYRLTEENDFNIKKDILDKINDTVDIMFICNPNNPTGLAIRKEEMINIVEKCKKCNTILVVDECFIDFLVNEEEYSISKYIDKYDNLIILKAFTKIYAMAGIRLGYMLSSNNELNKNISNIGQPWSVSTIASKCGVAALKEREFVNETKKYIAKNREYLICELRKLGLKVIDGKANYLLFKAENKDLKLKLEEEGILIRSCNNYIGLDSTYYRIAVKSEIDNERLIKALKKLL